MRKLATYREETEQDYEKIRKMKKQVFESDSRDVAFTKTQLRKRAGWNDTRIEKFLGCPDFTTENSYKRGVLTSWYMSKRVEKAESYKTFQKDAATALAQHEKRKKAAEKAVATKKKKTLEKVEQRLGEVILKKKYCFYSKENLYRKAAHSYNDLQEMRGKWDFTPVDPRDASKDFLNRISVNYLRHHGTTYDGELEEYFNSVGKQDALDIVRKHVYFQIAECYPFLKQECIKQAADRGISLYEKE